MADPSPSPDGTLPGPYGGGTTSGLTVPVQPGVMSRTSEAGSAGPDPRFITLAIGKLQAMIGPRYYLVSTDKLTEIATKLWNSVSLQTAFGNYMQAGANAGNFLPALEAQIQNLILAPQSDPSIDPSIISDYIGAKQGAGASLSTAELAAMSTATQAANAPIPEPFGTNTVSGYDFGAPMPKGGWSGKNPGQSFGWSNHLGVDYGTPAGSRIVSPFAGTVTVETGVPGYGNYVTVTLDNGWKMGFGHVANASIQNGARVNPGDLIAISGANVGSAQGAVTIVTWQDPNGKYLNPHDVLDPIFKGTTFSSAGIPGAAGTGYPSVNTVLDQRYPSIKKDFEQYFGTPPSPEDVFNIVAHGTDPQQWTDYIRSMTSHITGMNMGQAFDLRSLADSVSMTTLGHTATDGVVKDLFDQGLTGQKDVQWWYGENSPNEIDKQTYNSIYNANKGVMAGVLNEKGGFDPRIAKAQAATQTRLDAHGGIDPNKKGPQ